MFSLYNYKQVCTVISERPIYKNQLASFVFENINNACSWYEIFNFFKYYSKGVKEFIYPNNFLNIVEGCNNPTSQFIVFLLAPENQFYIYQFMNSIRTEEDVVNNKFIINELIFFLWTNPIEYYFIIDSFIRSPVLGSHFTFCSPTWVDAPYYEDVQCLKITDVDKAYCSIYNLFQKFQSHNLKSCKIEDISYIDRNKCLESTLSFKEWSKLVYTDLYWRNLLDELPNFKMLLTANIQ